MTARDCLTSPVSVMATTVEVLVNSNSNGSRMLHTGTISKVKDTILLEDRTQHGLNDDRGAWVGDE
jgi:hypothetical protein